MIGLIIFLIIFFIIFFSPFMAVILPAIAGNNLVLIGVIVLALVIYIISVYNNLRKKKLQVEQTRKGIDIYLKQRFDLIPNLVETVKGYKNYESEILEKLVSIRSQANKDNVITDKARLNDEYNKIIAIVENYPELKANESFLNLQKQLAKMESQLQAARRIYNVEVTEYNTKVATIPTNIVAKMFGFTMEKLFEINETEKQNIDIDMK